MVFLGWLVPNVLDATILLNCGWQYLENYDFKFWFYDLSSNFNPG